MPLVPSLGIRMVKQGRASSHLDCQLRYCPSPGWEEGLQEKGIGKKSPKQFCSQLPPLACGALRGETQSWGTLLGLCLPLEQVGPSHRCCEDEEELLYEALRGQQLSLRSSRLLVPSSALLLSQLFAPPEGCVSTSPERDSPDLLAHAPSITRAKTQ